jgi:hypothetical protein
MVLKNVLAHTGIFAALMYNTWISFRVLDDWFGVWGAIGGMVLLPITSMLLPIAMLFFSSSEAGGFALLPGLIVISVLYGISKK